MQEFQRLRQTQDSLDSLHSIGSSDATVPPRNRQQVGRYFQRLADELGD